MEAKRKFFLHDGKTGAAVAVRVQPKASKNEITEIMGDGTIKVRLTAPAVEGKANQALIDFFADLLRVPKGDIEIVAGETGRKKLVSVFNMTALEVQKVILTHMEGKK